MGRIRPRVLVDVSRIDMSTRILGHSISAPILIAPTAMHKLAHPEGELATARAAAASQTIMVVSFSATCTMEEIASTSHAIRFFQLYMLKNREVTAALVHRAEASGYKALVLTVDTPRLGRREADIKNKMISPQFNNLEGIISTELVPGSGSGPEALALKAFDQSLNWKDIAWLSSLSKLPILIKGILTTEDAIKAVEMGVDGIIVSNHGARQLDYAPPTISALEQVCIAVKGRVPILLDGGIRRGTDVFKALALGAQAVLVGRPVIFGLAVKGELGVRQVLTMLKDELETSMSLAGSPTLKDITRDRVTLVNKGFQSML